ncbi:MAG TPA: Arc family DNA-binding protein [Burkholderiaceae bacterium]|jgi:plasmid stability protein|nr:Arc family DNA-binding protein [Burkholderiaceae bacterium]
MPNLSIKDVPEALAERLRQRAAANHRSLQGELMSILELAMSGQEFQAPGADQPEAARSSQPRQPGDARGTKTSEQVAAEVRRRWPVPFASGPLAVDILRQERDAR